MRAMTKKARLRERPVFDAWIVIAFQSVDKSSYRFGFEPQDVEITNPNDAPKELGGGSLLISTASRASRAASL